MIESFSIFCEMEEIKSGLFLHSVWPAKVLSNLLQPQMAYCMLTSTETEGAQHLLGAAQHFSGSIT